MNMRSQNKKLLKWRPQFSEQTGDYTLRSYYIGGQLQATE